MKVERHTGFKVATRTIPQEYVPPQKERRKTSPLVFWFFIFLCFVFGINVLRSWHENKVAEIARRQIENTTFEVRFR